MFVKFKARYDNHEKGDTALIEEPTLAARLIEQGTAVEVDSPNVKRRAKAAEAKEKAEAEAKEKAEAEAKEKAEADKKKK